jgi:hypothetical protein
MSSLRRTQSSRANGAKSPGPSTPLAKQRSSQNALRHGLLAKCIVLKNEARENFDSLVQQHVARFEPADGVEVGMIEDMCAACWRLHRPWAIETRMLDKQMDTQSATDAIPPHKSRRRACVCHTLGFQLVSKWIEHASTFMSRTQPNSRPPNKGRIVSGRSANVRLQSGSRQYYEAKLHARQDHWFKRQEHSPQR